MRVAVFDTETTGLVKGNDYTNPNNPHLAAIAIVLYDTEIKRIISSFNTVVQPDGWEMPEEVAAINNLSTEYLMANGLWFDDVMSVALGMLVKADMLVAHNTDFDSKVLAASMWRKGATDGTNEDMIHASIKRWLESKFYCTMKESKDIVQALDKRGRIKYPRLAEAYKHFFNRELRNAHNAGADAVAALEVYIDLQNN